MKNKFLSLAILVISMLTVTACGIDEAPAHPDLGCSAEFSLMNGMNSRSASYNGGVGACEEYLGSSIVDESQINVATVNVGKDGLYMTTTVTQVTISGEAIVVAMNFGNPSAAQLAGVWKKDSAKVRTATFNSAEEVAPSKIFVRFSRK